MSNEDPHPYARPGCRASATLGTLPPRIAAGSGYEMTWEQRMAERAACRAVVREAETLTERAVETAAAMQTAEPNEAAYIEAVADDVTEETATAAGVVACACVGPPPGCVRCYCELNLAAIELWRQRRKL